MAEDVDTRVIARVTITRVLTEDDIVDHVIAQADDGTEFGLAGSAGHDAPR